MSYRQKKTIVEMTSLTSDLFPADELEGSQQLAAALVAAANREPGEPRGGREAGPAHAATHELVRSLQTTQPSPINGEALPRRPRDEAVMSAH